VHTHLAIDAEARGKLLFWKAAALTRWRGIVSGDVKTVPIVGRAAAA
jgi:hypothetical protein